MFTLYVQNADQGFGWTRDQATSLWSNYLMFVYASPLVGGFIADWKLGYRRSVMIGGFFFMAGHVLLAFRSEPVMYAALACLVIGNGFFKPNVSAMVGNLYPEGSHLKDRAYNIFYMGINVGAFLAPIVAEIMKQQLRLPPGLRHGRHRHGHLGVHPLALPAPRRAGRPEGAEGAGDPPGPPPRRWTPRRTGVSRQNEPIRPIDQVPDWKRIVALIVIFLIVIVFWMVFHQNQTTLTYWADENTDWNVTGIISNAINPCWVILLTFPLVWFWGWLDARGLEPSTPTKMAIGMCLTGLSFFILYFAGKAGGDTGKVSPWWLIGAYGVLTLGELMLSPMGLSLVSKVAPHAAAGHHDGRLVRRDGDRQQADGDRRLLGRHGRTRRSSPCWAAMALVMAVVLMLLLRPLKKAMPGI